jgi:hypothetical protein
MENMIENRIKGGAWLVLAVLALVWLLPTGRVGAATGGPDSYGYRYVDSKGGGIEFMYEDIEKTGIKYYGFDKPEIDFPNLLGQAIPIGFTFKFYGQEYHNLYLAGNGYLQFTPDSAFRNYVYDGGGLSSQSYPNNIIAPLWGWHDTYS